MRESVLCCLALLPPVSVTEARLRRPDATVCRFNSIAVDLPVLPVMGALLTARERSWCMDLSGIKSDFLVLVVQNFLFSCRQQIRSVLKVCLVDLILLSVNQTALYEQ